MIKSLSVTTFKPIFLPTNWRPGSLFIPKVMQSPKIKGNTGQQVMSEQNVLQFLIILYTHIFQGKYDLYISYQTELKYDLVLTLTAHILKLDWTEKISTAYVQSKLMKCSIFSLINKQINKYLWFKSLMSLKWLFNEKNSEFPPKLPLPNINPLTGASTVSQGLAVW